MIYGLRILSSRS